MSIQTDLRPGARRGNRFVIPALALAVAIGTLLASAGSPAPARGVTITWTGLGASTNWSQAANWSTLTVPGPADVAVFDGTSAKPALMNVNVSVAGIDITTAYLGVITQGVGRRVTIGAGGWSQAGGAFIGTTGAIAMDGPWSLTGGAFTSTAGTWTASASLNQSAGSFVANGGTLRLVGPAATIDVAGSLQLWNLTLAHNNLAAKTLVAGESLVVDGSLALTNGSWDGGELQARGPITQAAGFDGGTGTLRIDGASDQTFTGSANASAGALPNVIIAKPSGTLALAGTIRVVGSGWTYLTGTLDPGGSLVVFDDGSLVAGSHALANVTLRGAGAKAIVVGDVLTVSGTLALTNGTWDGGMLSAHGSINQAAGFDGGTGTLRIDGAVDQLFTGSAGNASGALPSVIIDKPSGILSLAGTIRTANNWTHVAGAQDAGTTRLILIGPAVMSSAAAPLHRLDIRGGTASLGAPLTLTGELRVQIGSLDLAGNALDVAGSLIVRGTLLADGVELHVGGDVTATGVFDGASASLVLDGSVPQTVTIASTAIGELRVENSAGALLGADLSVTGLLDLPAGPFSIGPHRLTIAMPIVGFAGNLMGDSSSAVTIGGVAAGIRLPASIPQLRELQIVNPTGVTLDGPLDVTGQLILAGGNLVGLPHIVSITPGASVTRTSGHVVGSLQKAIASGGPSTVAFEIGDASGYAPIEITWTTVGTSGSMTASTVVGDDPGLAIVGLVPSASVNRTWTVAPSGLASDPALVTLNYLATDLDPGADPGALAAMNSDGGVLTLPTVVSRSPTSATLSLATAPSGTFSLAMRGSNLDVGIDGPTTGETGRAYRYLIVVGNAGAFSTDGTRLSVRLPGLTVSGTVASQGSCSLADEVLTCDLGPIPSAGHATVEFDIASSTAGVFLIAADVAVGGGTVDPEAANDAAELRLVIGNPSPPPATPVPSAVADGDLPDGDLPDTAEGLEEDEPWAWGAMARLAILLVGALVLATTVWLRDRRR